MLKTTFICVMSLMATGAIAEERPGSTSPSLNTAVVATTSSMARRAPQSSKPGIRKAASCASSRATEAPQGFMNGRVIFADNGGFDHLIMKFARKCRCPCVSELEPLETLWKGGATFCEKRPRAPQQDGRRHIAASGLR